MGIELWKTYDIQNLYSPYDEERKELNSINEELNEVICDINEHVRIFPGLARIFAILSVPCIQCCSSSNKEATCSPTKILSKKECGWQLAKSTVSIAYSCYDLYSLKQKFVKGEFSDVATALRKEANIL